MSRYPSKPFGLPDYTLQTRRFQRADPFESVASADSATVANQIIKEQKPVTHKTQQVNSQQDQ
jgi:hypothetical protein